MDPWETEETCAFLYSRKYAIPGGPREIQGAGSTGSTLRTWRLRSLPQQIQAQRHEPDMQCVWSGQDYHTPMAMLQTTEALGREVHLKFLMTIKDRTLALTKRHARGEKIRDGQERGGSGVVAAREHCSFSLFSLPFFSFRGGRTLVYGARGW